MPKKLLLPDEARAVLARRHASGHRQWLVGGGDWPLVVALGSPTEREAADDMAGLRAWVAAWTAWSGPARVEWDERQWARLGTQRLPARLLLDSPQEAADLLGQGARWKRARARYDALLARWPVLQGRGELGRWFEVLADYPDADFTRLTDALAWFLANPASGLYLRQVPIAGLDTKWLEKRTALVTGWLALLRGTEQAEEFHAACGLTCLPHRVRMRVLCPALRAQLGGLRDIEAPLDELAQLALQPRALLVVENQQSGVALPDLPGVVAFMRLGNAVGALAALPWLAGVPALYWGDIDTYGLAILSRARRALPGIVSVLMDEATLLAHRALWVEEPAQHPEADLAELTAAERQLFAILRTDQWGPRVRLEQERLAWPEALAALRTALARLAPA